MIVTCALVLAVLLADTASQPLRPEDKFFQYLGFTPDEQNALRRGEIVSHVVKELSDKELAITMAVLVPASIPELLEIARSGKELEINRDILSHGAIEADASGEVDPKAFERVGYTPSEADEVRRLFEAEPGSGFNLSQAELQRFADLRTKSQTKACEKDSACTSAVVASLRDVLRDRFKAYHERGLSGIEPYVREPGKTSSPASELRTATNAARFLAQEYPRVFDAFLNYPRGDQAGIESYFLWLKQRIQDRPTFILAHRVLAVRDGMAFAAERQFYVGQSYNSLQILYGLLPREGGTLVYYINRTSTDQVAGFMTATRHSMGRKIMEKEVRKHFEEMLANLKSQPTR